MKLPSTFRFRGLILAGVVLAALSLATTSLPLAQAQTSPPAPAGAAIEKDKETGKTIITTPSGLKYADLAPGTGPAANAGDHIAVNYEGKLIDGTKFDSSYDRGQPIEFVLGKGQVIQGWDEGLAGMKVGGKRKLIIPPQLGYGLNGQGDVIPPNATLIFNVELVSINPK